MKVKELTRMMNADPASFIGKQQRENNILKRSVRGTREWMLEFMKSTDELQREILPDSECMNLTERIKRLLSVIDRALPPEPEAPKKSTTLDRLEVLARETYEFHVKYMHALRALDNLAAQRKPRGLAPAMDSVAPAGR